MAKVEKFEDLEVWQLARELAGKIYSVTRSGEFAQDFGLRDQIRRAVVSILSNIAEGFDRRGDKMFQSFLAIAKGSAGEVRCQLYIAHDLKYLTQRQFDDCMQDIVAIGKMLTSLIKYLRTASPAPP